MIAFILAGGKGSRLKEFLPADIPKPLAPIAGKPMLRHQIEYLANHRIPEVVVSVGWGARAIKEYFGDGQNYGLSIKYSEESRPLGTAGAFKYSEALLAGKKNILILYGDVIFDINLSRMIKFHEACGGLGTILVHPNDHPSDSDLLEVDASNRITHFYPKPHPSGMYYRNLVNAGIYILKSDIVSFIKEGPADFGKDVFPDLIRKHANIYAYRTSEYVKDAGTPERIRQVEKDIMSGKVKRRNLALRQKAIFMDRDGVINEEVSYVCKPEDFNLMDGSAEAIRKINKSDYLGIVITNQSAVARGFCSEEEIKLIHKKIESLLGEKNAFLDAVYYCPHYPDDRLEGGGRTYLVPCNCRKPSTGMIQKALDDFHIDREQSFIIGDGTVDVQTGRNAGIKTILLRTGHGGKDGAYEVFPDFVFQDLREAVNFLIDDYESLRGLLGGILEPYLKTAKKPLVISIGGLSRCGKSTISTIIDCLMRENQRRIAVLRLDDWLSDVHVTQEGMDVRKRYDYVRIERDLKRFLNGEEISVYHYDSATRRKTGIVQKMKLENHSVVLIDGVVALDVPYLREIGNCKIYIDISEALRKKRFYDFYRYKGLALGAIEHLYRQRQADETDVVVTSRKYADHILRL